MRVRVSLRSKKPEDARRILNHVIVSLHKLSSTEIHGAARSKRTRNDIQGVPWIKQRGESRTEKRSTG
jgi:hypothetical protein